MNSLKRAVRTQWASGNLPLSLYRHAFWKLTETFSVYYRLPVWCVVDRRGRIMVELSVVEAADSDTIGCISLLMLSLLVSPHHHWSAVNQTVVDSNDRQFEMFETRKSLNERYCSVVSSWRVDCTSLDPDVQRCTPACLRTQRLLVSDMTAKTNIGVTLWYSVNLPQSVTLHKKERQLRQLSYRLQVVH